MKAVAIFILFIGMFLVIQGYYSQFANIKNTPTVIYRYIPRSIYDEQLSSDPSLMVSQQFKSMFEDINPWPPLSAVQNSSGGIQTNHQIISESPSPPASSSSPDVTIVPTEKENFKILNAFEFNRT